MKYWMLWARQSSSKKLSRHGIDLWMREDNELSKQQYVVWHKRLLTGITVCPVLWVQQLCSHTNHQSEDKKLSSPVTSKDVILPQFEVWGGGGFFYCTEEEEEKWGTCGSMFCWSRNKERFAEDMKWNLTETTGTIIRSHNCGPVSAPCWLNRIHPVEQTPNTLQNLIKQPLYYNSDVWAFHIFIYIFIYWFILQLRQTLV